MGNIKKDMFIGLDIGTDSVGYAVTDSDYRILKHRGEDMWGSCLFESGATKAERRGFRSARRRLDRRQWRVALTQEIFASEIRKVDENFFIRLQESGLYREDTSTHSQYTFFEDDTYTDKQFHAEYPTIHHLIVSLMENKQAHDVRLVYIAVAWLMAHRGHFLNEVDKHKVDEVTRFDEVYQKFEEYCNGAYEEGDLNPFIACDFGEFQKIMLMKASVSVKEKAFFDLLNNGKTFKDEPDDIVSKKMIVKLLSGGTVQPAKLFISEESKEAYKEVDSVRLGMEEEKFAAILTELGDEGELLLKLRQIYDWSILAEILHADDHQDKMTISKAKVEQYEQHKKDLNDLKKIVRKYIPDEYNEIFREQREDNYVAYSGYEYSGKRKSDIEKFSAYLTKKLKAVEVEEIDAEKFEDMMARLEIREFLPKQVNGDNRVIPYQLYWDELNNILQNVKEYLPFLNEKDADGFNNIEKLLSVFEFRIPYYVGPLRADKNSKYAWMQRKAEGKIYPWNFYDKVDLDASEKNFISRMTNSCTYVPGEKVLPKNSLLYSKFMVLNEINNIKVNGVAIDVELKQKIYKEFEKNKKVTRKKIEGLLASEGCFEKGKDVLSGIDINVNSSLKSYHVFKNLLESQQLTLEDAERIIEYMAYTEDKNRFKKWLAREYSNLSEEDRKYIAKQKLKDFGRLSKKFLTGVKGISKKQNSYEKISIIDALWNTNDNLMQILSDQYTFMESIKNEQKEYYEGKGQSIDELLDDMYVSNSVRRPIYRTLAILEDINKATKTQPKRIFIEMARGGGEKGKRTVTRRKQIEEMYKTVKHEDIAELSKQLEDCSDNKLQSEAVYLYFMQLGRCMYSGEPIRIEELPTTKYNIDHIYPQSAVKDDSIDNKVLVLSTLNGDKKDIYPIPSKYREKAGWLWNHLHKNKMISDEKYKRLMRTTGFTDDEKMGFINRQLVETRQSTKALGVILEQMYPDTEIVYAKARLASEFRQEYEIYKSRSVNDLHHAKDAYLNIVCGNVYHCRFTRNFMVDRTYSLKTKTLFGHQVHDGEKLAWAGEESIAFVKRMVLKQTPHYTRFAFERKGGLFDQMPLKKGEGAVPRKKNLPIEKYGGYNKSTATFYLLVKYKEKKKTDIMFMPVDLYAGAVVLRDEIAAKEYAQKTIATINGKKLEDIQIIAFPLGLRKIKVNTILSLDGFRIAITGKASGGKQLLYVLAESLKLDNESEKYIKRIDNYFAKKEKNKDIKLDSEYDEITKENNSKLFNIILEKGQSNPYIKISSLREVAAFISGVAEKFDVLSLEEQALALTKLIEIYKSGRAGSCDLSIVKGSKNAATMIISSKLSNWKKNYSDVRIVDTSASGIYTKESCNLLELL